MIADIVILIKTKNLNMKPWIRHPSALDIYHVAREYNILSQLGQRPSSSNEVDHGSRLDSKLEIYETTEYLKKAGTSLNNL